jgi:hypothetical protein
VPTLKTGDDAKVAAKLTELHGQAQNAMRTIGGFALYCFQIKFCALKHGQWLPWLEANCPGLPARSVTAYMSLTESALRSCGVKKIKPWIMALSAQIGSALPICHSGELLLLPEAPVPEKLAKVRQKFFDVVDGKSMRQLFAEFKQVDENGRPKRGNLSGRGNPKRQRDRAKMSAEERRIDDMEIKAVEATEWLLEVADDKHLGLIDEQIRRKLLDALDTTAGYVRALDRARQPEADIANEG